MSDLNDWLQRELRAARRGSAEDRNFELIEKLHQLESMIGGNRSMARPGSTKNRAILFMDVAGWSEYQNRDIADYVDRVLPEVAKLLRSAEASHLNTWGDAIVATFDSVVTAAEAALAVRDHFRKTPETRGLREGSACRIALHVGEVMIRYNPILERDDIFGHDVHLAARLEPVTDRGQVFCTEAFAQALHSQRGNGPKAVTKGRRALPKGFGEIETFVVLWPNEPVP
jgi:class 3 adenylate cyclase